MTPPVDPGDWVSCLEHDYLESFIKDGGATVKFGVASDQDTRQEIRDRIVAAAETRNYLTIKISAESTRVHMVEQVFFAVAGQTPWEKLGRRVLKGLATATRLRWPPENGESLLNSLAEANETDPGVIKGEMRTALTKGVYRNTELAKQFRVAMMHLGLAVLSGGEEGQITVTRLTEWLTGRNRALSAVKPYQIYSSINRANARYLLESLCRWTRMAELSGLVLIVDMDRVSIARNPRDGGIYYTKAALLDSYEVLRQFIDGVDRLQGVLIAVLPSPSFVDLDDPRGLSAYAALRARVYDEVRGRRYGNPGGALVRLAANAEQRR
jgi:hypothetical protein